MTRGTRERRWTGCVLGAALALGTQAIGPAAAVPTAAAPTAADPADGVEAARAPGEVPVLFVHGYDGDSGKDCNGATFGDALAYFVAQGRDRSSLVTVGYYDGDTDCDVDVTDRPTDNGTRIKTIAAALANHVHDRYTRQGRSIDIVAHSMGGLVTRVALLGSAQGWEGFPPEPILVDDVVTLGTPHQGVRCEDDAGDGADDCPDDVQWRSMDPDSTFMRVLHSRSNRLDQDWAAPYDWTFAGSKEDETVSYGSAIDKARPADHKFGYQGGDTEGTVTHAGIRELFSGDYNLRYWHALLARRRGRDPHHRQRLGTPRSRVQRRRPQRPLVTPTRPPATAELGGDDGPSGAPGTSLPSRGSTATPRPCPLGPRTETRVPRPRARWRPEGAATEPERTGPGTGVRPGG